LRGKIEEIQLGDIMAHVVVRVGDNLIESAITRRSADELRLKKGDTVAAVIKATEAASRAFVMLPDKFPAPSPGP
jgi:molybdopterin-binding protein